MGEREKCGAGTVLAAIRFIQRLDKKASKYAIQEGLMLLSDQAAMLARRELVEAGKL